MTPVRIRIRSAASGDRHLIEQEFHGMMTEKSGKHYVMYAEDQQSGLGDTKTTLKWGDGRIIIMRSGSVDCRQEFCEGQLNQCYYRTPYLKILLTTVTHYAAAFFSGGAWHLQIDYLLYHEDEPYGKLKIFIEIEEESQVGH